MKSLIRVVRKKLENRRHLKAHLWQSAANYVQQGSALVMSMVLARLLTPEHFGQFAFASAYVLLFFMRISFGLDQILVSKGKNEGDYPGVMTVSYVMTGLRFLILIGLACWLLYSGKALVAVLCLLCGLPEAPAPVLNAIKSDLEGSGNFRQNMEGMVWSQAAGFVAAVIGAVSGLGVFALCFSGWLTMLSRILVYRRYATRRMFPAPVFSGLKGIGFHGAGLWLNNAAQVGISRIDKWFVGAYLGEQSLGYYNRAFNWTPLSLMFLTSLITNPSVVAIAKAKTLQDEKQYIRRVSLVLFSGALVTFFIWFFFAEPTVLFLFGANWNGAVPVFRAFATFELASCLCNIPFTVMLARRDYMTIGFVKLFGLITLFGTLLFLRQIGSVASGQMTAYVFQASAVYMGLIAWARVVFLHKKEEER